jgi:hypothetical protein
MGEKLPQSKTRVESMEATLSQAEKSAISELAFPIQRILSQIEPELEEGAYRVVIGDDVSGRIPAIIVNEAISRIYKAYGHPAPMLRFVAGGRRTDEDGFERRDRSNDMRERTRGLNDELLRNGDDPRALLVTEAIATGNAMHMATSALRDERIKTDIAALGFIGAEVEGGESNLEQVKARLNGARLVVGTENLPSLYGDRNLRLLQGISKERGSSTSTRLTDYEIFREDVPYIQAKINAARVLAMKVGGEVADVYLAGKLERAA